MKKMLINLLYNTCCALNEENIEYWVDFGTLLGIYREGNPILYDNDIDICIINLTTDKVNRLAKNLENRHIYFNQEYINKIYRCRNNNSFVLFNKHYGFSDLYINKIDKENKMYISPTGEKCNISMDLIGIPQDYKWKDIYIKVPQKIHETLVYRYGNDYMTPRPFFRGRDPKITILNFWKKR